MLTKTLVMLLPALVRIGAPAAPGCEDGMLPARCPPGKRQRSPFRLEPKCRSNARFLHGRARDGAIRAEHAAIPGLRPEQGLATGAPVEIQARVRWHRLDRGEAAVRAGELRFEGGGGLHVVASSRWLSGGCRTKYDTASSAARVHETWTGLRAEIRMNDKPLVTSLAGESRLFQSALRWLVFDIAEGLNAKEHRLRQGPR
jgi:hypothetical protein